MGPGRRRALLLLLLEDPPVLGRLAVRGVRLGELLGEALDLLLARLRPLTASIPGSAASRASPTETIRA